MDIRPDPIPTMNQTNTLPVERLAGGEPVIAPSANWWETGVTFNAAATYLEPNQRNDAIIRALLPMRSADDPALANGVVAIHYRARPEADPGSPFMRSFIGLALFTPEMRLLYRYQEPVIYPSPEPHGYDHYGVEDPRITRIGDTFYMVYCGVKAAATSTLQVRLCLATSNDLLHWDKHGIMPGDVARINNKDGVLFPEAIGGRYYLLHRPFSENHPPSDMAIRLAVSDSPFGPWQDLGEMLRAFDNHRVRSSWVGAGSVPFKVNEQQYIEIYHTGNYLNEVDREYDLDAALLDFMALDPTRPSSLVTARLEPLMAPETPAELRSKSQLQVGNVLFACGSYEYEDWVYIVYGGADTYTLAARLNRPALISALRRAGLANPFTATSG